MIRPGAQCYASSLWVQQLNEAWKLKSTLYSDNSHRRQSRTSIVNSRKNFADGHARQNNSRKRVCERIRKTLKRSTFSAPRKDSKRLSPPESNVNSCPLSARDKIRWTITAQVLKLAPDFHDAELTIGLMNYVIGSFPLPTKMLAATMGVRGSKKRGLETLERVAKEGKWARDICAHAADRSVQA